MAAGVYQIRNIINGKRYIGSAVDIKNRWGRHRRMLRGEYHPNVHLQRAWNKYGEGVFRFDDILECGPELCVPYEQWLLDHWKPEYNMCPTAGSRLGRKHTDVAKARMSKAHTGKVGHKHTNEAKARMGLAKRGVNHPRVKLTKLDVYEIRRLYSTGKVSQGMLGKMFKMSRGCMGRITRHEIWRHLK